MEQLNLKPFPYRTRRGGQPSVTIQKRGAATMNPAAVQYLGSPEEIMLLYDEERRVIAVRAVEPGTEGAYPLRPISNKDSATRTFAIKALLTYYGIDLAGESLRYRAHELGDKTLAIYLREPPVSVSPGRGRPGISREPASAQARDDTQPDARSATPAK